MIAIFAGLAGAKSVVATDINAQATVCARYNVTRHKLSDTIEVRQGDLFSPIRPSEKFDLIIFNLPYILGPAQSRHTDDLDRAFFDPGYETQRRFLDRAKDFLNPKGCIAVSFSNAGSIATLLTNSFQSGYDIFLRATEERPSATNPDIMWDRRFYLLSPRSEDVFQGPQEGHAATQALPFMIPSPAALRQYISKADKPPPTPPWSPER